eukprot:GDKJ01010623.1.p1 GENE.GDKJ01010623.1~~GDKJ01010623.1.p1  ORF type:complete len:420 (+),score=64.28 GDKJ01010623.1:126-1262(+)
MKNSVRCHMLNEVDLRRNVDYETLKKCHDRSIEFGFVSMRDAAFSRVYSVDQVSYDVFLDFLLASRSPNLIAFDGKSISESRVFTREDISKHANESIKFFSDSISIEDIFGSDFMMLLKTNNRGDVGIIHLQFSSDTSSFASANARTSTSAQKDSKTGLPIVEIVIPGVKGNVKSKNLMLTPRQLLEISHELGHAAQQILWTPEVVRNVENFPQFVAMDVIETPSVACELNALKHTTLMRKFSSNNIRDSCFNERLIHFLELALLEKLLLGPDLVHGDTDFSRKWTHITQQVLKTTNIKLDSKLTLSQAKSILGLGSSFAGSASCYLFALARACSLQGSKGARLLRESPFKDAAFKDASIVTHMNFQTLARSLLIKKN